MFLWEGDPMPLWIFEVEEDGLRLGEGAFSCKSGAIDEMFRFVPETQAMLSEKHLDAIRAELREPTWTERELTIESRTYDIRRWLGPGG